MAEVPSNTREVQQPEKAGSGSTVVVISELVKQFGKLRAIDNLNMTINTGETFGLIGPNGSGKTTLIRMLVGLMRPTSGAIRIMGERIPSARIAPHIGYMTQLNALYLDLTAKENMQFFCNIYGLRGKQQKERIDEMLERVDLANRTNDVVGTFSGGMKQRLSLACALVHHPSLALLDEPTVGVDPELRRSFWDYFAQLNSEGITIIVSTHHLDEAARCTRLGLMRSGALLAHDTQQELLRQSSKDNMEEGIFLSTFAQNEFQIVQFIPLVVGVQVFLSGIFWPIAQLPGTLRPISYILPLTYANDALRGVMLKSADIGQISGQLAALLIFALAMIMLSSLTMRRQIA